MLNALSVDLEDWYQAISTIDFNTWDRYEDRILDATNRLLDLLLENSCRATFFVLGYVAERHPILVKRIHRQGHEIACHSYFHKMVYNQSYEEFKQDLIKSKHILEQIIGEKVIGFRAPWFSITKESLWALDLLKELDFEYDSSIFPINMKYYGISNDNGSIYKITTTNGREIQEISISKISYFGLELPVTGGFYFRISPYWLTKKAIEELNRKGKAIVMYTHPWEFDKGQPRLKLPLDQRSIHYANLKYTEKRFKRLLKDFKFGSVKEVFNNKLKTVL